MDSRLVIVSMLLTTASSVFGNSTDCTSRFLTTVEELYPTDDPCIAALEGLVSDPSTEACTTEDRNTIGNCLKRFSTEWRNYETDCETVEILAVDSAPAPTPTPSPSASDVVTEETTVTQTVESPASPSIFSPAALPAPEPETTEAPGSLDLDFEEILTLDAMEPVTSRRKLLVDENRRRILNEDQSCSALFLQEGFSAFADLTKNNAGALHLSIYTLFGTLLLALMLF